MERLSGEMVGAILVRWLRLTHHPCSIADHRSEVFDAVEQFGLLIQRRIAQPFGHFREIIFHNDDGTLEVLVLVGMPVGLPAGMLEAAKLNDFAQNACAPFR